MGYFLHQSADVCPFLIPFQGWLISYYLLKIKGNTEAIMKKWLKVLLVAQGFFLKKNQNNKLSHNTTGIENMAKRNSAQITISIWRSTC